MTGKIYMPPGISRPADAVPEAPARQSAVEVTTKDGERIMFPQVAVAMVSPDVLTLIAEAVARRLSPEEPTDG